MTIINHNMAPKVHRYDSFNDKIRDYHLRRLRWLTGSRDLGAEKFQGEYNTLVKAKNDIKNKIKGILQSALFFPDVVQWGCQPNKGYDYLPYKQLDQEPKMARYPKELNKNIDVRKDVEEETKEFVSDVFSVDLLSRMIDCIFYRNYGTLDEFDIAYRVNVAEMLIHKSVFELSQHMDPSSSKLLLNDLMKASEIASSIKFHKRK